MCLLESYRNPLILSALIAAPEANIVGQQLPPPPPLPESTQAGNATEPHVGKLVKLRNWVLFSKQVVFFF